MPFSTSQDPTPPSTVERLLLRSSHPGFSSQKWSAPASVLPWHNAGWSTHALLALDSAIHKSAAEANVISTFETQNVCPRAFLFLSVLNKGSLRVVCTQQYLLWEDEVRLEECF